MEKGLLDLDAQEFSQKELAAKTVSLNQLNDQSTSEVRESVVSQALDLQVWSSCGQEKGAAEEQQLRKVGEAQNELGWPGIERASSGEEGLAGVLALVDASVCVRTSWR